jgi:hypothetical protein
MLCSIVARNTPCHAALGGLFVLAGLVMFACKTERDLPTRSSGGGFVGGSPGVPPAGPGNPVQDASGSNEDGGADSGLAFYDRGAGFPSGMDTRVSYAVGTALFQRDDSGGRRLLATLPSVATGLTESNGTLWGVTATGIFRASASEVTSAIVADARCLVSDAGSLYWVEDAANPAGELRLLSSASNALPLVTRTVGQYLGRSRGEKCVQLGAQQAYVVAEAGGVPVVLRANKQGGALESFLQLDGARAPSRFVALGDTLISFRTPTSTGCTQDCDGDATAYPVAGAPRVLASRLGEVLAARAFGDRVFWVERVVVAGEAPLKVRSIGIDGGVEEELSIDTDRIDDLAITNQSFWLLSPLGIAQIAR